MPEQCICKKCGNRGATDYPIVTFRTMTVHSGRKPQKYQAMGEVLSIGLCSACIDAWIAMRSEPKHQIVKALKYPVLLAVLAVVVHFLGQNDLVRWVMCALFGGFALAIVVSEMKRIRRETTEIRTNNGNFSRDHMIEELAASLLPKKHADAHLSYVLRAQVMDVKQHERINKEYGISKKKLTQVRQYLMVTPEAEVKAWKAINKGDKTDDPSHRHVQNQG